MYQEWITKDCKVMWRIDGEARVVCRRIEMSTCRREKTWVEPCTVLRLLGSPRVVSGVF